MSGVPFVDLKAQYREIEAEVRAAMDEVLAETGFILGPAVERFEGAFAESVEAAHAVGVSSGLDALRMAFAALEIGPGDEVVIPANTYIATALAVSAVGARPVLVDCDRRTYCIDPAVAERALTARTKAIVPVHLAGRPAPLDPLLELAASRGIHLVEDAAQAHGAMYAGRPCGTLGAVGCFSFYPGKNLGAYGDAGAVVTDDALLAERIRRLRDYGQRRKYEHVEKGTNARLDGLQAAVLSVKLPRLDGWNARRREHADRYRELLRHTGDLRFQSVPSEAGSNHVYHLFVVETERRDALQAHLASAGIATGIHYPIPIHLQEAYNELELGPGAFPVTERLARTSLSLPMYPELEPSHIELVVDAVAEFFASLEEAA